MNFVVEALRNNPELAVFLTVALGFLIGKLKFGSFSLGVVVGCLLAGVLVGQLDIKIPATVKAVFFDLFLFTTGYKVGPQFFRALKKDALPQMALTVVLCVTCLLMALTFAKLLGYDMGTAAGLLAGAFSESTVIGTAGEAIQRLDLPEAERRALINNIPVAYAVTYLVGTTALVWFLPKIGPKLMGIDLREAAREATAAAQSDKAGSADEANGITSAARLFDVRAYRVENAQLFGKTIAELEALPKKSRIFVLRGRSGDVLFDHASEHRVRAGDVIAVMARFEVHAARGDVIGPEVSDPELLDIPLEALDVIVTSRKLDDTSLAELAEGQFARGVFLAKLTRSGIAMPVIPTTRLNRGDVMSLVGPLTEVERVAAVIGYSDRRTPATDMVFVGLGIFLGGLFGLLSIGVWGVPLTLTASGGALFMGLLFGWLRSAYPFFGRIPEPAIWIFDTVGLCMFIGIVGLGAGPSFVAGLKATGLSLVAVGLMSSLLPHTVGILFGRYVLRMDPLIVLGACAGAGTITAALRAIQDEAQSSIPALGYTVPYAIGNILLTAWGPVLIALMTI